MSAANIANVSSIVSVENISFDVFDAFIPMESEFIDKKMSVCDWNLLPGCFVRRVTQSNDDQIGSCKEAKVKLCLKTLDTNEVIENVDRSQFVPVTTVSFGTLFLYKSWVGKVMKVMYSVTIKLDDNSRGVVHFEDISEFVDQSKERRRVMPFCAYNSITKCCVGKRLIGPKKQLRDARWLQISDETKKCIESDEGESTIHITLTDVGISELRVQWLYCISEEVVASAAQSSSSKQTDMAADEVKNNLYRVVDGISSNGLKAPSKILKGKDLSAVKSLNFISNCLKSRVGENGYYIKQGVSDVGATATSTSVSFDDNTETTSNDDTGTESLEIAADEQEPGKSSESLEKEKIDDEMNGNDDGDLLSIMVTFFDDTEPLPLQPIEPFGSIEQYKRKKSQRSELKNKRRKPSKDCFSLSNNGVPVQIVSSTTLVTVVWPNGEIETDIPPSALVPFDYFMEGDDMFPGKFVQKIDNHKSGEYGVVQNVSFSERTANVNWYKRVDGHSSDVVPVFVKSELVSTYDIKKDPRLCFYRGAYIYKTTHSATDNGSCNRVGQVINPWCDGQVLCGWADGSQSRVYPDELLILSRVNAVETSKGPLPLPKTVSPVLKSVKETTESLKAMLDKMKNSKVPTSSKFVKMLEDMLSKESKMMAAAEGVPNSSSEEEKDEGFEETCDNKLFDCGELKTLETVPDDHKYKDIVFQPANPGNFMKRVKKELMILKNSLPPTILVKTFENRLDLFSVMICGPKETPYEDGVFLFDIQLPATYPNVPPVVHYYSYCSKRMNPNLYEDGLVCLSLLGTWTGSESEMWSPKSNLLQLLVSIQGLILVDEPYFNEPGYVRQKGTSNGSKKSKLYNEMVVIKLVQSMSKLIQNP
ncbi:hypothetical protein B4U80_01458, partial [Leptotrombidium deliense]